MTAVAKVKVRCPTCGAQRRVFYGECLANGWPKCCDGQTMRLERAPSRKQTDDAVRGIVAPAVEAARAFIAKHGGR